ncbi:MAG TPA: PHP domain-containing protein [Mycobacteriales bacterium]|nr:PHP domain-containing protein [Mycobacteriales bacterium]
MIDLHTHSTASDGTLSPASLVTQAREAGLSVVALTDHDTTSGWDEAAQALPRGLSLVRGAELSCTRDGTSLHLLAYLFDPTHRPLADRLAQVATSREMRAKRMVELLAADGHPVTWDQVRRAAGGTVGRPHVARALIDAGLVTSVEEAFTPDWIGPSGRYWAAKDEVDALEAIALVRSAGGVTVFAHPAAAARGRVVGDHVVEELAAAGLDGLEVDHPDHAEQARARLRDLAADLDLLVTGASDFHGTNKVTPLGAHVTAPDAFDELVGRATGVGVL